MEKITIALAGNPNVGKSTIFNNLTGMHQHTGNWPGKTVANATGECKIKDKTFKFVDLPGTYSIMSNSEEEEIARNYLCFGNADATVVVVDSTSLERNLNLVYQIMEITPNVILCVNLLDEAKNKKIKINLKKLSKELKIPVVGTIAKDKKTLENLKNEIYKVGTKEIEIKPNKIIYREIIEESINELKEVLKKDNIENEKEVKDENFIRWISQKLIDGEEGILKSIKTNTNINIESENVKEKINEIREKLEKNNIKKEEFKEKITEEIIKKSEKVCKEVCIFENKNYSKKDIKIDKILTSKQFGIPIMILFLGIIFWITIKGANYPSEMLFTFFHWLKRWLIKFFEITYIPKILGDILLNGVYDTLTWVIAVMLPPLAIFFPLFTFLEDLGYLPRIAFNMDKFFKKACCTGKQMITMCMGFGCNACGVVGCRIINSPRERLIAILTNSLIPCNRKISNINYNSNNIYSR